MPQIEAICFFLKEKTKVLFLLCSHHAGRGYVDKRSTKQAKVFWFFFSKKKILSCSCLTLASCGIYHAQPIGTGSTAPPPTADATDADSNCFEAATEAEKTVCITPDLRAPDRAMLRALQADIRDTDIFSRDMLLASQRAWLLNLAEACHDPACLGHALAERTRTLQAWRPPATSSIGSNAIAQYVSFRPLSSEQTPFCTAFARRANMALARTGTLQPAAMGATELAGTHGSPATLDAGRRIEVPQHQANVYGRYQNRALGVRIGGTQVIDSLSLTKLAQGQNANQGGRFSAYASQTGDYGSIDVFRMDNRLLALVADAWGPDTPGAPGEYAHAAIWDVAGATPTALCAFDTYHVPADTAAFGAGTGFAAWRDVLASVRDSTTLELGTATLREQSQLRADTDFMLLNMPLVTLQQANSAGWTIWLRKRHDAVLDALFAWSTSSPDHKRLFDALFAGVRSVAQDIVTTYQKTQALSADEARQAAGLAIMELLYGATVTIAPGLGSDLGAPQDAAGYRPRYAILAAPQ
jgi:uncharacterized protein